MRARCFDGLHVKSGKPHASPRSAAKTPEIGDFSSYGVSDRRDAWCQEILRAPRASRTVVRRVVLIGWRPDIAVVHPSLAVGSDLTSSFSFSISYFFLGLKSKSRAKKSV